MYMNGCVSKNLAAGVSKNDRHQVSGTIEFVLNEGVQLIKEAILKYAGAS